MYDDDEEISNLYELFPELEGFDPEPNVDWLNELRRKVWREILIAIPIITAQLILYSVTTEVFWFLLIGPTLIWLFRKVKYLGNINTELTQLEEAEEIAFRTELPVTTKLVLAFGIPIAVVASVLAANTYDPELLGVDNEAIAAETKTPYHPDLLGTVKLSPEQEAESTWENSTGVSVWLPEVCDLLVIEWHTENLQEEEISNFTQIFYYPGSMETKTLIIGTDNQLSDRENRLIADAASCYISPFS
jgi:hypothetical protein